MNLLEHVFFFVALSAVIVVLSAFYADSEDGPALRSLPRRFGVFLGSCAAVAVVMLVLEHLFASAA